LATDCRPKQIEQPERSPTPQRASSVHGRRLRDFVISRQTRDGGLVTGGQNQGKALISAHLRTPAVGLTDAPFFADQLKLLIYGHVGLLGQRFKGLHDGHIKPKERS